MGHSSDFSEIKIDEAGWHNKTPQEVLEGVNINVEYCSIC